MSDSASSDLLFSLARALVQSTSEPAPAQASLVDQSKIFTVDKLQSMMLGGALMIMRQKDIDMHGFDYSKYDGSKLPPPSGMSMAHAAATYLSDGHDFKNQITDLKLIAIHKYIQANILKDRDTLWKFFKEYMDLITKNPTVTVPEEKKA